MQLDFVLPPEQVPALQHGAILVPDRPAIFRVEGPGALTCLQGLLTSDLVAAGEGSLSYGGMLTSKGMILLDPFVLREGDTFTLILSQGAREIAATHFRRVLPPRLATVTDLSDSWAVSWVVGGHAPALVRPLEPPAAGKVTRRSAGGGAVWLARATASMPWALVIVGEPEAVGRLSEDLEAAGLPVGDESALAAARILAGWPSLGREIDGKTLPQEVRYDALGAVSYSKGCYTGQETVARVHFRGHPNRELRGALLSPGALPENRALWWKDREVGVVRSTVRIQDRTLALVTVRREVPDGALLLAPPLEVRLVGLPMKPAEAA
jgi:folate-binding protein YgfZ